MAAVGAGLAVFSAVTSFVGGRRASKAAKRAAAEASRQEKVVTRERLLQIDQEEKSLRGTTLARAAGSGSVVGSGSVLAILAEQAREFERERVITRSVGASKVRATLAQGDSVAAQASAQGLANLFSGLSSAASLAYQSGLFKKT
jgi:hypothetical protein